MDWRPAWERISPEINSLWQRSRALLSRHPMLISSLALVAVVCVGIIFYAYSQYLQYAKLIEARLGDGGMRTHSTIFAAPKLIAPGDAISVADLVTRLQSAGYTEQPSNPVGWYRESAGTLEVTCGAASYFQPHHVVITVSNGKIANIFSRTENKQAVQYWLEPELVTNLSDVNRGKRRPVPYSELPKHLVEALISVEDKRFFSHSGLDIFRLGKAVYVDLKERRKEQGASTITMQLARSFWLDQDKNWRRKIAEVFLTAELERRFSKEKILELYANEIYLGRRGSFSIHGFGEAARVYFGKDVRDLTLPESAMLVGIIQRPGYFNPFRHLERVKDRRDLALTLMRNNGYVNARQLAEAIATPIRISPGETESTDAPYLADLINEDLQNRFQDWDFSSSAYRIYSTIDLDLQRSAVEAVKTGMQEVDKNVLRMRGKKKTGPLPQVALVALDPHTGAVKALVGGRSYSESQLNRAEAMRQPGSSFKPFVFAAALNAATQQKKGDYLTVASTFEDEPTTFRFRNQTYSPGNFHDDYHGTVNMRQALAKSMNIPTIKIAEQVGYKKVVDLAKAAGIESPIQATPSVALGSYEVTPLEIANAYTIFSNGGAQVERNFVSLIRDTRNNTVFSAKPKQTQVMDPRVAYIMDDLLSEVLRSGTGAGVRSRGFALPAAGKTGTSRDGWFVGFTSTVLCAVWVGYDDNAELELEGSKSAMPVWVEFMKRAHKFRQYANARPFPKPAGLVTADIDPETGALSNEYCPTSRAELFLAGTQPKEVCTLHNEFYTGEPDPDVAGEPRKPSNVFGRVLGIFK